MKISPMGSELVGGQSDKADYDLLAQVDVPEAAPVEEPIKMARLFRKHTLFEQFEESLALITYDNVKASMVWFLSMATCTISFNVRTFTCSAELAPNANKITLLCFCISQFEDVTLWMTLFVLFGDDIKLVCSPIQYGK